jgi:hypothetical protein
MRPLRRRLVSPPLVIDSTTGTKRSPDISHFLVRSRTRLFLYRQLKRAVQNKAQRQTPRNYQHNLAPIHQKIYQDTEVSFSIHPWLLAATSRVGLICSWFLYIPSTIADQEAQVFFPQSDGQSNAPSESGNMQGPDGGRASTDEVVENSIESTGTQDAPSESNATDQLQDAGAGKVRGPGGRFFPKKVTPSQSAKSRRSSASARPLLAKKGMLLQIKN